MGLSSIVEIETGFILPCTIGVSQPIADDDRLNEVCYGMVRYGEDWYGQVR